METQQFIHEENTLLRKELDRKNAKINIYEDIIFNVLETDIKFELVDDDVSNDSMIVHITVPEKSIKIESRLSEIRDLMIIVLSKDRNKQ